MEGVRPWGNPCGAVQFGSSFFMITGFHGTPPALISGMMTLIASSPNMIIESTLRASTSGASLAA
jgi:heme/copper-type cytochrome/quinol oxidase subunit 3